MFKNALKRVVNSLGYEITIRSAKIRTSDGFQLYQYQTPDGAFDYERYRRIQISGNKRKLDHVWVREENIALLADYIRRKMGKVTFGICHGTRRGREQEWFRKYLDCEVIGTDISDTAREFPSSIQWDFHDTKPEWIDAVDFIYSNSFDHSYDPEKCLNAWMSCIKRSGLCILEHSSGHERSTRLDPFGAHFFQMPYLILKWGAGRYFVTEVFDAALKPEPPKYIRYLIIRRS